MPRTSSVGNGRSEICWAVVTPDGRFAFTTNFADGAVSRYAIAADGPRRWRMPRPASRSTACPGCATRTSPRDGRFLYAIDADSGRIFGWSVGAEGSLEPVGSWEECPATVAGLAAR